MPSFVDRVRAFLSPVTKDATTVAPYGSILNGMRLASGVLGQSRRHRALRHFADHCEPVRNAINWRKQQVADAGLRIVRTDDPNQPPAPKVVKQVMDLLRYVNPSRISFPELMYQVVEDTLVLDRGCTEIIKTAGGQVIELWPVDGATIAIDPSWSRPKSRGGAGCDPKAIRYRQYVNGVLQAELRNDQLAVIVQNPATWRIDGLSQVEMVLATIERYLYGVSYAADLVKNPVPPGIAFINGLTDAQLVAFRAYYSALMPGEIPIAGGEVDANGKGGVQFAKFAWSPKDLMFAEWIEFLVNIVAYIFQIDRTVYGLIDDVNRSTAETISDRTDQGLSSLKKRVSSVLTRELIAQIDDAHGIEFEDVIVIDQAVQAKIDQTYSSIGVFTPNMILARMGLDPVPWGDVPYNATGTATPDPLEEPEEPAEPTPADDENDPKPAKRLSLTRAQRVQAAAIVAQLRYRASPTAANARAWHDAEEVAKRLVPFDVAPAPTPRTKRALPLNSTGSPSESATG